MYRGFHRCTSHNRNIFSVVCRVLCDKVVGATSSRCSRVFTAIESCSRVILQFVLVCIGSRGREGQHSGRGVDGRLQQRSTSPPAAAAAAAGLEQLQGRHVDVQRRRAVRLACQRHVRLRRCRPPATRTAVPARRRMLRVRGEVHQQAGQLQ